MSLIMPLPSSAMVSEFSQPLLGSNLDRRWRMRLITLFSCLGILFIEEFCNTYVGGGVAPMFQYPFLESLTTWWTKCYVLYSTWVPFVLIPIPLDSIDKVLVLASYSLIPPSPHCATMCFSKKLINF